METSQIDTRTFELISEIVEKIVYAMLFDQNKLLNKAHLLDFIERHAEKLTFDKKFKKTLEILQMI